MEPKPEPINSVGSHTYITTDGSSGSPQAISPRIYLLDLAHLRGVAPLKRLLPNQKTRKPLYASGRFGLCCIGQLMSCAHLLILYHLVDCCLILSQYPYRSTSYIIRVNRQMEKIKNGKYITVPARETETDDAFTSEVQGISMGTTFGKITRYSVIYDAKGTRKTR